MRKKNETYSLKGLQGVEIKVMDGSDRQSLSQLSKRETLTLEKLERWFTLGR